MKTCALIIVNWNSLTYLLACLDAVYKQSFQDFSVFVVDNNSSESLSPNAFRKYPRLTLIENNTNLGFAAANNKAIQQVEGCPWIVLLNPDTLPEEKWLEMLVRAAESNPEYSFFGSLLLDAKSPAILDGLGDVYHISGLTWRFGHGLPILECPLVEKEIFSPCAAAAMYRREDLLSVGGFDEDFFCYCEDVDLGFRLRHAGHRALSVPSSRVLHYGSGVTGLRSNFSNYHGHRNMIWAWFKNMPLFFLILFFPLHVLYNCASIVLYISRGQGKVVAKAKWDGLIGCRKMWQKRKLIQKHSQITLRSLWATLNTSLLIGPRSKYRES